MPYQVQKPLHVTGPWHPDVPPPPPWSRHPGRRLVPISRPPGASPWSQMADFCVWASKMCCQGSTLVKGSLFDEAALHPEGWMICSPGYPAPTLDPCGCFKPHLASAQSHSESQGPTCLEAHSSAIKAQPAGLSKKPWFTEPHELEPTTYLGMVGHLCLTRVHPGWHIQIWQRDDHLNRLAP